MVSDALNNYMLENKHTTATVVPAFNRVQRRPPSNRYIISISWVSKMENQSQVTNWVPCRGGCWGVLFVIFYLLCVTVHSCKNTIVHFENQFSSNHRVCITATVKIFTWPFLTVQVFCFITDLAKHTVRTNCTCNVQPRVQSTCENKTSA